MTREFFKAVLEMFMLSDGCLDDKRSEDMRYFLNQKARDFGYQDWADAYHKL